MKIGRIVIGLLAVWGAFSLIASVVYWSESHPSKTSVAVSQAAAEQLGIQPEPQITYSDLYSGLLATQHLSGDDKAILTTLNANHFDIRSFTKTILATTLADPNGWVGAGVRFVPGDSTAPHITVVWVYPDQIEQLCPTDLTESQAVGCTIPGGLGGCTVNLSTALLFDNPFPDSSVTYTAAQKAGTINHEFGHCLGFAHTTTVGDLMYPSINQGGEYPSAAEIDRVHSNLVG